MSGTSGPPGLNALQRPLGRGLPLPGGDVMPRPPPRLTLPGGGPGGGGGNPIPRNLSNRTMQNMAGPPPPNGNGGGTIGSLPAGGMSFDGSRQTLMDQHKRNKAALEASVKALNKVDLIRKGLEKLSDKQDLVTMDDIVDEAGKLVAHGIDPVALAGILADAPQEGGGEALGGWVASHAQTAMIGEQNLIQHTSLMRHRMGVSAMHLLMAHANAQNLMGGLVPKMGNGQQNGSDLSPTDTESPTPQGDQTVGGSLAMGQRFMPHANGSNSQWP